MKKALIIGIDEYLSAPLNGCVNDAKAITSLLLKNGDGSPNFDVNQNLNEISQARLKSSIVDLFKGNPEVALLYFSGHGFINELGGYIVTPDHQKYDEGISMYEILVLANKSKAKDKVIILDCCHSGAFGSPEISLGALAQINEGVTILTASKDSEVAIEVNGHGIFTNLLLDGLEGGAADLTGQITPGSLYAYIDQALGPWDQRPIFKTNVTRFISLRTIHPKVPLEVLRKLSIYFPDPKYHHPLDPTFEYTNVDIAIPKNVTILKDLQKMNSVGIIVPVDEEYMYWAAQNSKTCKLTPLGHHYWRLVKDDRI